MDEGGKEAWMELGMERGLSLKETAEIVRIPLPTLSYWVNTGVIRPKATVGEGRGRRHKLSFLNLIEVLTVDRLRRKGLSMQRLRKAVEALEAQVGERPLAKLTLLTDGGDLFRVVEGDDELAQVVRCHDGQGIFAITFAELCEEVVPRMKELVGA